MQFTKGLYLPKICVSEHSEIFSTNLVRITVKYHLMLGAIQYLRKQVEVGRWSVKCLLL